MQQGDPTKWTRDETPKTFRSPLDKDVIVEYFTEDNQPTKYIIPYQKEITEPTWFANMLINKILDVMMPDYNPEKREELRKQIEI